MSIAIESEALLKTCKNRLDRLRQQFSDLLQQGLQPRQLAMALALGATIGMLPTVWGTSLLCFLCAGVVRLNHLAVQIGNYLVYPLQILFFIPYLKFGELLFSCSLLADDPQIFLDHLQASPLVGLEMYWKVNMHAIIAWLLTSPALGFISFLLFQVFIKQLKCVHCQQRPDICN